LGGRTSQYSPNTVYLNMPYRKQQFTNDEIYHIILRAIDDNLIFKDTDDYYRGIFSIYEFNNVKPIEIWLRRKQRKREKALGGPSSQFRAFSQFREKLVDILAFCFMPNHIHLLLKQIKENGITQFMRKVGTGYAGYFNRKYQRKGYVFQNRFLAARIKDNAQLKIVFTYIHTNPISLIEPKWKEIGIKDSKKVIKFLEDYKWSSYPDYINKKNFSSVTERELMLKIMEGEEGCKSFVENWVKYKEEIAKFSDLFLE